MMNREQKAAQAAGIAGICAILCIGIFIVVSIIHVFGGW
jgi:hypothetical protein